MSQPPAFQFYARDWLMSTRALPPEARGVYIDLLSLAWDQDGLPDNEKELCAYLALTPAKFKRIWELIEDKFPNAEDGFRRNPRQERQRQDMASRRQKRADAGRKGGQVKAKRGLSK